MGGFFVGKDGGGRKKEKIGFGERSVKKKNDFKKESKKERWK